MLIWYLARAAGLAAFLSLSVATGVGAFTARRTLAVERRVVWQYVHRAAALSGVALIVVHVSMLLADSYAHVGLGGLVPFGSGYRPLAVTFGVISMYLLVLIAVTGALRSRIARSARGSRIWRAVHLSAYAMWASSAWHFLAAGTDAGTWWARLVLATGISLVAAGLLARLSDRHLITTRRLAPAVATSGGHR